MTPMRKLIAWNLMTLDGYFEGPTPWSLDFHGTVFGPELQMLSEEQLAEASLILFGRKTYEGMVGYWSTATESEAAAMNNVPKAVISNTLNSADWNNTTLLKGDAAEQVRALKAGQGGPIFVFGSAELLANLLSAELVDEYRLCIAPVLMGQGTPLFKAADARKNLELKLSKVIQNGGLLLFYSLKPS
jgi:dihydrofolate reductase